MASLAHANLPSEDEEDEDYAPSEEDEETRAAKRQQKQKRLRGAAAGAGPAGGDAGAGVPGRRGGAAEEEEEEDDVPEAKREAKKAKIDALWSQLSQKTAVPKSAGGGGLGGLTRPAGPKAKAKTEVGTCRAGPCRQRSTGRGRALGAACGVLGQGPERGGRGCAPPTVREVGDLCLMTCRGPRPSPQAWMRELGLGPAKPKAKAKPQPAGGAADEKKALAAAALAAAKTAASATAAQQYGRVVVTETRRFAGEPGAGRGGAGGQQNKCTHIPCAAAGLCMGRASSRGRPAGPA